ncbi:MAG: NYN domain-containing protein [Frankia sp.]
MGGISVVVGTESARLAVLIDAENAPLWVVEPLLTEIARYGKAQVKRAYGDWSAGSLKGWKKTLLEMSIRPVQVFAAVKGKNAADLALAIDAMDLLHSGSVDGFCLVSSDSDFTRLAERIRETGLTVYGFGEQMKTNPGLPAACDTFLFVETLAAAAPPTPVAKPDQALVSALATTPTQPPLGAANESETSAPNPAADTPQTAVAAPPKKRKKAKTAPVARPTRATTAELRADAALVSRLREAVATNPGPDGWTHLSAVGSAIRKRPAVVLKTYGYARLKDLIVATDLFEVQQRGPDTSAALYVRAK